MLRKDYVKKYIVLAYLRDIKGIKSMPFDIYLYDDYTYVNNFVMTYDKVRYKGILIYKIL